MTLLYIDEHGKNIVFDNGDFKIAVDDVTDARYITFWCKEIVKGKEYFAKRGYLDAWKSEMKFKDRDGLYLSIRSIEIEKKYRGRGYGAKMYKALATFCHKDIKGIYSYLPNRVNKKQIPYLYKKMGGITDGDYEFIDFK